MNKWIIFQNLVLSRCYIILQISILHCVYPSLGRNVFILAELHFTISITYLSNL